MKQKPPSKRQPVNSPEESYRLAKGIVAAGRLIQEHIMPRLPGRFNPEMFYAMVDAAAKVTSNV